MDAANAVPVVGTPLAYGLGFTVLLLIVFTGSWADSISTIAHEGGHIVMGILTFRGPRGFTIEDGGGGATPISRFHWSVSDLLTRFAGYAFPPLLGLGGAWLVRAGNPGGALVIALVLMIAAFFQALNPLATLVTLLVVLGVGWTLFAAGPVIKAGVAVTLVWWMLIGGAWDSAFGLLRGTGDGQVLARRTLIPRFVWEGLWLVIAAVCLWKGGRALLSF